MNNPSVNQPLTVTEQDVLHSANAAREQCVCGEVHHDDEGITPAIVARMKAHLAEHPDHRFVVDDEAGIIAVVISPAPDASGPLQIIAQSDNLLHLLNDIGAPCADSLS